MARPARYNADYYTHTASLRNDRKVKAIRTKFGAAGYGIFHMLLEALTDADHTALDTSALELELLAGDFGVESYDIEAVIKFGQSVGYFTQNEAGLLTCPELSKWLEPVFEKRNRSKNLPAAALLSQPAAETGVSVTETPQSKVKESKGEESKETTSSLQSEVAAPQKKIEVVEVIEPLPESLTTELRTPGGAAEPGSDIADKPDKSDTVKLTKHKGGKQLLTGDLAELLNPGGLAERVQKMKSPFTQFEADALCAKYGTEAAQQIVKEMANYAKLTNNISVNLTAQKWLDKRQPQQVAVIPTYEGRQVHTGVVHPGSVAGRMDTVAQARAELLGQL